MSDAWEQWIGQLIDGRFLLLQYLGGSDDSAVFLTERRERGEIYKAAIKLIPHPSDGGERQFAQWRRAVKLSHPNLIRLFAMGRGKLGGEPLLYVVMEYADENVASVLPGRALAATEAQVLLTSAVDVLAYLHQRGLVHGRIKPSNILSDGDQVKLSSDKILLAGEPFDGQRGVGEVYDAPEYGARNGTAPQAASPAGDVWSLALTLGEALTQTVLTEQALEEGEATLPAAVREPFHDIVRQGLRREPQDRWTLAEISARLGRGTANTELPAVAPKALVRTRGLPELPPLPPLEFQTYAAKWGRYAIPAATALAFIVVILAGARLFHRAPTGASVPSATLEQPQVAPAPLVVPAMAEKPQQRKVAPKNAPTRDSAMKQPDSEKASPVPASVRTEISHDDAAPARADSPPAGIISGAVLQRATPDVLPRAQASIRGTVRVNVRVDVDPTGAVEGASLAARGPSLYFARLALDNARSWRFAAAKVAGRNVLSRWTLRYEFTRYGTNVVPTQDVP